MQHIQKIIPAMVLALMLAACSTKITLVTEKTYPPVNQNSPVKLYELNDSVPINSEILGIVRIGDTGFTTNCSYDVVINQARAEARKIGGNAIHITEHILPSMMGSTCHQITAELLRVSNDNKKVSGMMYRKKTAGNVPKAGYKIGYRHMEYKAAPLTRFRITLDGGYGLFTVNAGKTDNSLNDEMERRLRSGLVYSTGLNYYFTNNIGMGAKYLGYHSSVKYESVTQVETKLVGGLKTNRDIYFAGPTFNLRFMDLSQKNGIYSDFGIGYLGYKDYSTFRNQRKTATGATAGIVIGFGYDKTLSDLMALGVNLNVLGGALTSYTVDDGIKKTYNDLKDSKQYVGLGRIDLTVGLRFNFGKAK